MATTSFILNFRVVFQVVIGLAMIMVWQRRRCALLSRLDDFAGIVTRNWRRSLVVLSLGYFLLAFLCKISQEKSLLLSGADFWLFEDMLRSMARGEAYVTRFAPQALGPVQHGAVHPFLSLFAVVPAVWLLGPTTVALAFNPFFLALGGFVLGHLAFEVLASSALSLLMPACFWMSEWISRTLLYEMHPEAAYPLFTFAAVYCVIKAVGSAKQKNLWFIIALLSFFALTGVKQDGMLVAGLIWLWFSLRRLWSLPLAISSAVVIIGTSIAMALIVQGFRNGALGAESVELQGVRHSVVIPQQTSSVLGGHPITGVESVVSILRYFLDSAGGLGGLFRQVAGYFIVNPFLSFALVAPWIWMGFSAWILVFPMAFLFAMIGPKVGGLQNYYSAPLVSLFWVAVIDTFNLINKEKWRVRAVAWITAATAFVGANGPKIHFPNAQAAEISKDAGDVTSKMTGLGVVSSRLLSGGSMEKVWSDRLALSGAPSLEPPQHVQWVLLPKDWGSYEIPQEAARAWRDWALASGRWKLTSINGLELYQRLSAGP